MFPSAAMSRSNSISEEASVSSETRAPEFNSLSSLFTPMSHNQQQAQPKAKKKRSQPGNPDPDSEVIALSPKTLMTTNRFVCEICSKGFQRDQNLQLHRRGHNLPWKLRQRSSKEGVRKKVYVCPEESCVHHQPSRALGDLTGIKKHYSRKHGEKKWKCERCSKRYAVHSDWKAHAKTCGTREYKCDCGTIFSRKDSFITHRAFCDALAEESARITAATGPLINSPLFSHFAPWEPLSTSTPTQNPNPNPNPFHVKPGEPLPSLLHPYLRHTASPAPTHLSATALLQKACTMGSLPATSSTTTSGGKSGGVGMDLTNLSTWQNHDRLTRDFLGVADAGDDELLSITRMGLDLVTAPPRDSGAAAALGFPPVTQTWADC